MECFDLDEFNELNNTDYCILEDSGAGKLRVTNPERTVQDRFYNLFFDYFLEYEGTLKYIRCGTLDYSFYFDHDWVRVCVELL